MPVSQADSYNGIALHFNVDKDIRRITNVDNIITVFVQKGDWSFIKGGLSTKTEMMLFYYNWYYNKTEHYQYAVISETLREMRLTSVV